MSTKILSITSGSVAAQTGRDFEEETALHLQMLGFKPDGKGIARLRQACSGEAPFKPMTYIASCPSHGIKVLHGGKDRNEFLIINEHGRQMRIECKNQNSKGSVDEKLLLAGDTALVAEYLDTMLYVTGEGASPSIVKELMERVYQRRNIQVCPFHQAKKVEVTTNAEDFEEWIEAWKSFPVPDFSLDHRRMNFIFSEFSACKTYDEFLAAYHAKVLKTHEKVQDQEDATLIEIRSLL